MARTAPLPHVAMRTRAFRQLAEYGAPDPETGEAALLQPAIEADGYWLLYGETGEPSPLALLEGVAIINPVFAGMAIA